MLDVLIISKELKREALRMTEHASKLDQAAAFLSSLYGGDENEEIVEPHPAPEAKPKKKFSLATRRRMAAAQKIRYAKERAYTTVVKKRTLSPAGLRAIRKAQKARWARFKKQASV